MNKKDRQIVFDKYNGHCAYCGCKLEKGWHVDEVIPVKRKFKIIRSHWENVITGETTQSDRAVRRNHTEWQYIPTKNIPDGYENPENFNIDNQMPSCASCNINKHSMSLEDFRYLIQGFMKHLNEVSTQYKIAKRYGLVIEDIKPVVFYFEKFKTEQHERENVD
jgi:5-methylcytosine-specific restriction endonuclease McrA